MAAYNSEISENCVRTSQNCTERYYGPSEAYYSQAYPADSQQSDIGSNVQNEEWNPLCSPESTGPGCSPNSVSIVSSSPSSFSHQYAPVYFPPTGEKDDPNFDDGYYAAPSTNFISPPTVVRIVKRRNTANKKERRRTQSINTAFSSLRNKIPNVPADTKLSKIKTLRLATSYISYLTRVLEGDQDPSNGFRAELVPSSRKINAERRANFKNELQALVNDGFMETRKCKGRTGWPQHVWASELRQE